MHLQVFVAWLGYTTEKKRKAARMAQAMNRRREYLLKQGATQWLKTASDLTAMRQTLAIQQGAQVCDCPWLEIHLFYCCQTSDHQATI